MSAANEEFKPSRRGNETKSSANQQQRQNAASREASSGAQPIKRGGKPGQNLNKQNESSPTPNGPAATSSKPQPTVAQPAQEEHIPLGGFNASAVEAMLKRNTDAKAPLYKVDEKATGPASTATPASRSGSPWGTKPGAMMNGKDFWLELRKQVTSLQQSGGSSLGG